MNRSATVPTGCLRRFSATGDRWRDLQPENVTIERETKNTVPRRVEVNANHGLQCETMGGLIRCWEGGTNGYPSGRRGRARPLRGGCRSEVSKRPEDAGSACSWQDPSGTIAASRRARQRVGIVTTLSPVYRQAQDPVLRAVVSGTYWQPPSAWSGSEPARLASRHRRFPPADLGPPRCRTCRARLVYQARRARRPRVANQHVGGQRASAIRGKKRGYS